MLRQPLARTALLVALAIAAGATVAQPARPRIERAADLPRYSYKIDGKLEDVVRNAERFAPFAAALRRDTESLLAGFDIADKGTRRDLIGTLAALDYLDGRYESAIARLDEVKGLQDKPADKLLSGLRLRAMAVSAKQHAPGSDAFRKAVGESIRRELAGMPYAVIENDIKGAKAGSELLGESLVIGRVREVWQPIVDANGALSSDFAPGVVGARLTLTAVLPLKATLVETYTTYLAANKVEKPDIWAGREAVLPPEVSGRNVVVAVWDSGVETRLFPGQVLTVDGRPSVIAHDKYGRPAQGELMPIPPALQSKLPQMTARTKGLSDLRSNIDSAEASQVKQLLSTMPPEQYRSTIEELGLAGNYQHGTHVAGIALAGVPQARLVVGRIEFGHTLKPDPCPSREQSERDAKALQATVDHFKRRGVRVANLSWGGSVGDVASELEQCGIGKTPDERKTLAREYFDIGKKALVAAFASAPDILFITAAGNSNADSSFAEAMPADIVAPNLLTVGAVDRAGDEAPFTSYGPTVKVHANGYQVESFLPGGQRVALSGTSMAAPQVANLAAKLLVVNPKLKPPEVIDVVVKTAERSADGRRNLVHPRKALAAARTGAM
jgi:hypothetical protein